MHSIKILIYSLIFTSATAQSLSDFEKNPKFLLGLDEEFARKYEGLVFRWPSAMPAPLKFSIGEYKTYLTEGTAVDAKMDFSEKRKIDAGSAIINALLNNRNVFDYRSRVANSKGSQNYQVGFNFIGYGNKLIVKGEAARFFNAKLSRSGMAGSEETSIEVQSDTTFLAGTIQMPDSSMWVVDLEYIQNGSMKSISGQLYSGDTKYQLKEQLLNKKGEVMNQLGLILKNNDKAIAATDFPKSYGGKGVVLFSPDLPLRDRQAFSCASALLFAYWNVVSNL